MSSAKSKIDYTVGNHYAKHMEIARRCIFR